VFELIFDGTVVRPRVNRSDGHKPAGYGRRIVGRALEERVERLVLRYVATPSRQFPALRASGEVDVSLLRLGARSHPSPKIRWQCPTLLDHLDGDDSVPVFIEALLGDPVPRVRRHALHALSCDLCKQAPVCVDVVPAIAECVRTDNNAKVKQQARLVLFRHLPDERANEALAAHT
jgi:HEAT repeats